jgi:hypothetical protein
MTAARVGFTATLLADGRVLIAGGREDPSGSPVATTEIYDPLSRTFTPAGSMTEPRAGHAAIRLGDGRVLISGGEYCCQTYGSHADQTISSAELFDPSTGTFMKTGPTAFERSGHTAILLRDGRVLVVGGANGGDPDGTAEIYDPTTGAFTTTGAMTVGRHGFSASLLLDGRVLVAGGIGWTGYPEARLASAELYDPATGVFTPTGKMSVPRDGFTATVLSDGHVLMAGGYSRATGQGDPDYLAGTDIFDPASGTFAPGPTMTAVRSGQSATLLPSGRVLVIGGETCCLYDAGPTHLLSTTEFYDPATGSFRSTGIEPLTRTMPFVIALSDGSLLLLGGQELENLAGVAIASALVFIEAPGG